MKSFFGVGRVEEGVVLLDRVAGEGLTEKVNADQTPEGGERVRHMAIWQTTFQAEGRVFAKALGQVHWGRHSDERSSIDINSIRGRRRSAGLEGMRTGLPLGRWRTLTSTLCGMGTLEDFEQRGGMTRFTWWQALWLLCWGPTTKCPVGKAVRELLWCVAWKINTSDHAFLQSV